MDFLTFLVVPSLAVCAVTAIRHFINIRGHLISRGIPALSCLIPPLGTLNNALRIVDNDFDTALFYSAPAFILGSLIVALIIRKRINYSKADYKLMVLSTLGAGCIAIFIYLIRLIP